VKAPALRPGDTIGIIAPSLGGPATFPYRVERGAQFLESLGYRVVLAPHARGSRGYVSGTPQERAADIHALFADPAVGAIIAAIGGDHSCHLLPLLDWDLLRRHPTILMGFSDVTVLNLAIYTRTGLTTFNGPAIMTDFGEYPAPLAYTVESMQRALCQTELIGVITPATEWTEELLDWGIQEDLTRPRAMRPSSGWVWLKGGRAEGHLIGGCLESMQHLRGTPYWPDLDGAVLFIETSEEVPSPEWVDAVLQDYDNMGAFGQISGLLVGRCMGYTDDQKEQLRAILLDRTARYSFPIVTEMEFGHTAPQCTLPIGCRAEIDGAEERLAIIEAAVAAPGDGQPQGAV
jgi:muramoyltetrapeptide carboxypeptidase